MRIVHIIKHCHFGNGSVHVAVDLACMQSRAGHQVTFVSGGGTFVDLLERENVRHVTLRQEARRPHELARSAVALAALCRQSRPDVLHAHMMGSAVIGYAASRASGAALVTTVHNSFNKHSALMRLGDMIVAVSHSERQQLLRRNYDPKRVRVIWNAPNNTPRLNAAPTEIALPRPSIATVCGLHRRKGVFDLIEACAVVFQSFPEWSLCIAGEGPDREALQAQARELGMEDRVHFLGFCDDARAVFGNADIFVLASYADPGALSICEARSAGCAIVATAVGGTTEMLEFGAAGRLVPPGDPARLGKELHALMSDGDARAALSRAAREGTEVFDVARLVPDYDAVYREAIAARRAAPG